MFNKDFFATIFGVGRGKRKKVTSVIWKRYNKKEFLREVCENTCEWIKEDKNMMNCPYCGSEMEEGALVSRMVPQWIKKGEKKGTLLNCKKSFTQNEIPAHSCAKCKKIIFDI